MGIKEVKKAIDNIHEAQAPLRVWEHDRDPWKVLSEKERQTMVMYIVMQYRLAVRQITDEDPLYEKLMHAIQHTSQRVAAAVFHHIRESDPNQFIFY